MWQRCVTPRGLLLGAQSLLGHFVLCPRQGVTLRLVYVAQIVNIRLTHLRKLAGEHGIIIASRVMGQHAPATREAGSAPVGQAQLSVYPLGFIGIKPLSRLSVLDKATSPIRP